MEEGSTHAYMVEGALWYNRQLLQETFTAIEALDEEFAPRLFVSNAKRDLEKFLARHDEFVANQKAE